MSNVTVGRFGPGRSSQLDSSNTPTGGDGGDGGMLETRVARLESDVEYIKRDVAEIKDSAKILMADTTDIKVRLEKMAGRQDIFESKLDAMDEKLNAMDKKFDTKFDGLDKKFATKADLYEALGKQQQWMFRTMLTLIGLGIGLTGAIVAALIKYMPPAP